MDKFVLDLIKRLAHIFGGTRPLDPYTSVLRVSGAHPVYVNIGTPAGKLIILNRADSNLDFAVCQRFKEEYEPVDFFPGRICNDFSCYKYPVYLVVPWNAPGVENLLGCMRGLVIFNRVIGPDPVVGPHFDNEMGQWGAILLRDEIALKKLPYQEYDKTIRRALGRFCEINWLRALLEGDNVLYKIRK